MRRIALMTAGLALMMSVGFTGAAGAASMAGHIKPRGVWTQAVNGGCEVQTFAAGHTFTADTGDSGTYTGGGTRIKETFTAGIDNGLKYSGKYSKATGTYFGPMGGIARGSGWTGTMTPGATPGC